MTSSAALRHGLLLALSLGAACRRDAPSSAGTPTTAERNDAGGAGAQASSTAARLAASLLPLAEAASGERGAPGAVGIVTGLAHWEGINPLKIKQLTNATDVAACGERVNSGSVIAGAGGELANVVVELRRIGEPRGSGSVMAAGGTGSAPIVAVGIERCVQQPHVLLIPLGSGVEIENRDGILHELVGLSVRNPPFETSLPRYRRRAIVPAAELSRPERIRVACEAHPWAVSWWVITGATHHVLTGRDGRFSLEGVPAGTWRLLAWHEELGEIERTVDVRASQPAIVDLAWR